MKLDLRLLYGETHFTIPFSVFFSPMRRIYLQNAFTVIEGSGQRRRH